MRHPCNAQHKHPQKGTESKKMISTKKNKKVKQMNYIKTKIRTSQHYKNPDETKEKSLGIILYNPKVIIPGIH